MKVDNISIGDVSVAPGERRYIDLPLPPLYTHAEMNMPVYVLHGRKPGPRLFVSAAIHGDEINGVEIIRRLLRTKALKSLRGTLLAIPVVNPFGFINKSRYLPDRRDLNRSFPGYESGSLAARMAHLFMHSIVQHCDYGIDLHTAAQSRTNLPQIRAYLNDDPAMIELANAFNAPVVLDAHLRDGSLREAAAQVDTKILLYEGGEALRFDEVPIRAGVRGILAVMRHLDMLPQTTRKKANIRSLHSQSSTWVRATQSGILRIKKSMGQAVEQGDILGHITNPFGTSETVVKASASGLIIGRSTLPLVHEGEAIFHIARLDERRDSDIAQTLEHFQHEIDPDMESTFL